MERGGGIRPEEVPAALRLERDHRIGDALPDYTGWYPIEQDPADPARRWCWSSGLAARVFVPVKAGDTALRLRFGKIAPQLRAKVLLDGAEACTLPAGEPGADTVLPLPAGAAGFVTVTFVTDRLCRPCELDGAPDTRPLGIVLHGAEAFCPRRHAPRKANFY